VARMETHEDTRRDPPMDTIEHVIRSQGWRFSRVEDDEMAAEVQGRWCDYNLHFAYAGEVEAIHLTCAFDLRVPTRKRQRVFELLALINDRVVMDYLARLEKSDLVTRVRTHIVKLLASENCCKEMVAARLNMSPRNLQHKLDLLGTCYQDILDQTRQDLAIQYMANQHTSISEITYLLGFSDTSNFARAFKRWTGMAPRDFRDAGRDAGLIAQVIRHD